MGNNKSKSKSSKNIINNIVANDINTYSRNYQDVQKEPVIEENISKSAKEVNFANVRDKLHKEYNQLEPMFLKFKCRNIYENKYPYIFIKNEKFEFKIQFNIFIVLNVNPKKTVGICQFGDEDKYTQLKIDVTKTVIDSQVEKEFSYYHTYLPGNYKNRFVLCSLEGKKGLFIICQIHRKDKDYWSFNKTKPYKANDILRSIENFIHNVTDTTEPIFEYTAENVQEPIINPPEYEKSISPIYLDL